MYAHHPKLFELYVDINSGLYAHHLAQTIKNSFQAKYVLVSPQRNKEFYNNLSLLTKDFEPVYNDEQMSVFKIKD